MEAITEPKRDNKQSRRKSIAEKLTDNMLTGKKRSNYDPLLPRKVFASILGIHSNSVIRLENQGIITPFKKMFGAVEVTMYRASDIPRVFKERGETFKTKAEAEVIAIFSQKGGVGKSAMTQQLASIMSLVGKVLIIDLDAQADATSLLNTEPNIVEYDEDGDEQEITVADLIDWSMADPDEEAPYERRSFNEVVKRITDNIDVIPSGLDLGEINYTLNRCELKDRQTEAGDTEPAVIHVLSEVVDQLKNEYDYILFDCPPNIESCNLAALHAANRVLIPLELEAKTMKIMRRNIHFLNRLTHLNSGFSWDKILVVPNKYKREVIKMKAYAAIQDHFSNNQFAELSEIVMPNSVLIDKLADWRLPVYSTTSKYTENGNKSGASGEEITNYFWCIMHEILDLDIERLIFSSDEEELG